MNAQKERRRRRVVLVTGTVIVFASTVLLAIVSSSRSKQSPSPLARPVESTTHEENSHVGTIERARQEKRLRAPDHAVAEHDVESFLQKLSLLATQDKARALAFARSGDDWFPSTGVEAEARSAMAITLLVDLGQMPEARREVRKFIRRHPTSTYRRLVQGVTGIHPRPTGPDNR